MSYVCPWYIITRRQVMPGSHHLGRVDHWTRGEQQGADLERVEHARAWFGETPVELESGDCLIFHCNLLHSCVLQLACVHKL